MHSKLIKKKLIDHIKLLALLPFVLFSCKDNGCIEADDYGQYESQIIYVPASASSDNCQYNHNKTLDENIGNVYPKSFENCLSASGPGEYTDGVNDDVKLTEACNNIPSTKDVEGKGKKDIDKEKAQGICVALCREQCESEQLTQNTQQPGLISVPGWTSTDYRRPDVNKGVTIEPNTEILIRATGNISLSNNKRYDPIKVDAGEKELHVIDARTSSNKTDLPISSARTMIANINGSWTDTRNNSSVTYSSGLPASNKLEAASYNFGRRLLIHFTPKSDIPFEKGGSQWRCTGTSNLSCESGNNYSLEPLNPYGGVIISKNIDDLGLYPSNSNTNITERCNEQGNCDALKNVLIANSNKVDTIGNLSSRNIEITNINNYAVKLYIKSFAENSSDCNFTLNLKIKDENNNQIYPSVSGFHQFNVSSSSWKSFIDNTFGHITLEPGHKIEFETNATNTATGTNIYNCGTLTLYKMLKYHEIEIEHSGLASFADINETINNANYSCKIHARIINPFGNHISQGSDLPADFYEYDYNSSPFLNGLALTKRTPNQNNAFSPANGIFVRKGQKIRFDPESWDERCGPGYAIQNIKRPAILCKGTSGKIVINPDCPYIDYDSTGNIIGCKADNPDCDDSSNANYCPQQVCKTDVTCTNNGSAPFYQKTNCSSADFPTNITYIDVETKEQKTDSINCTNIDIDAITSTDSNGVTTTISTTAADCTKCKDLRKATAERPAMIELDTDNCYDFEEYKGSVAKFIGLSKSSEKDRFDLLKDSNIARGAKEVTNFNGEYGVFKDISLSSPKNNLATIKSEPFTIPEEGLLKFLVVSGSADKLQDLLNSSANGNIAIDFNSDLRATNGKFLDLYLCEENSETGNECSTVFSSASGQNEDVHKPSGPLSRYIVNNPDTTNNLGGLYERYLFDKNGYIYRNTVNTTGNGNDLSINSTEDCEMTRDRDRYFCHTNKGNKKKYRLIFRIYDPEEKNCIYNTLNTQNDGIKVDNPDYVSDASNKANKIISSNDGENCNSLDASLPKCEKQFICINKYGNNSGNYRVEVKVKIVKKNISQVIGSVINPIIEAIDGKPGEIGIVEKVYTSLINDSTYKTIVKLCLVLMVTFYGFSYLMGVSEFSNAEIITRVFKIGLIYFFIGDSGWYFFDKFVVTFFKDSADQLSFLMASSFESSEQVNAAIENSNFSDKAILFSSVDKVFDLIFADAVQNKIKTLLFTKIYGWAYCLLIYYGLFVYIFAVSNAVLIYLTAQIFISILFTLGPIFFIFILFDQTKDMFDNWLKALIGFTLQQIFLLTTLAFFNMLIYEIIKMVLNYRICYAPVWVINLYLTKITVLEYWTFASSPPILSPSASPASNTNIQGFPSLFKVLFIWVTASLMNQFVKFMTDLGKSIGGGISATSLSSGIRQGVNQMRGMVGSKMNNLTKRPMEIIDDRLFDSGRIANQRRISEKVKNSKDSADKRAMARAGDKAISKYKKGNAIELAGKSEEQKREILKGVRDEAMNKAGEKRGLSEKEIEKLKHDKGLKYTGTNVFGAATQAAKQHFSEGGTLKSNLENKPISTSFSETEVKKAANLTKKDLENPKHAKEKEKFDLEKAKGKTDQQALDSINKVLRKDLMQQIESGNIRVKSTFKEAPFSKISEASSQTSKAAKDAKDFGKRVYDQAITKPYEDAARIGNKIKEIAGVDKQVQGLKKAKSNPERGVRGVALGITAVVATPVAITATAATAAASFATRAAGGVIGTITDRIGITSNATSNYARKEAREQLMNEGKIARNVPEFIRKEDEVEMINQRQQQNKEAARNAKPLDSRINTNAIANIASKIKKGDNGLRRTNRVRFRMPKFK